MQWCVIELFVLVLVVIKSMAKVTFTQVCILSTTGYKTTTPCIALPLRKPG